jgi:signal transduction histidine kinase
MQAELDRSIMEDRAELISKFRSGGPESLKSALLRWTSGLEDDQKAYLYVDPSFRPLIGNLAQWPADLQVTDEQSRAIIIDVRAASARVAAVTLADGSHLLVGRTTDALRVFKRNMAIALIMALAFVCLLAAMASVSITRRTVGRIETINTTSRAIMDRGLSSRIPVRGTSDEWDQLAENLNSMLDRIEELVANIKRVSENVAHDLRTPLTRIRSRLETDYMKPEAHAIDRQVIGATISDLDDVLRMFASLMRISQIEAADRSSGFGYVNVVSIAREVAELFEPAAEEKDITIEVTGDTHLGVNGDRDLLFDALSNLVDNAIKYNKAGGRVSISAMRTDENTILSVADDGHGIPSADLPHVFKRFYRVEKSRGTQGHGLGLSLVAAVVAIHRARISLVDRRPGLEAKIEFPAPKVSVQMKPGLHSPEDHSCNGSL